MSEPCLESIARMREHARGYLADATSLQQMGTTHSDGAYLLQLIAFEVLLKAVLGASGKTPGKNHEYFSLFQELPSETRQRLLTKAASLFGPEADLSKPKHLLDTWSFNFVKLRYAYESYEGMSADEVSARGRAWLAAGAEVDEADFKYYPLELQAISEAMMGELDAV